MAEALGLQDFDDKNLKSCCCFHQEDTPSLIYNPKNYTFHCFGCQKTVDIIDVFMLKEHLSYIEAVKKLFDLAGIKHSFGEWNVKTKHQYIYPKEESSDNDKSQVYEYFATRKISKETVDHFDVRADGKGNAVFNYYDSNDVLTMVKYRPARKIDKRKKEPKCWCQPGADTSHLLFNMNRVNINEPLLIQEGECLCGEAEVFTEDGWVRLDEYAGQRVMQVDKTLGANFVKPLAYIKKEYEGNMVVSSTYGNYHTETTENHNLVFIKQDGTVFKQPAKEKARWDSYIPIAIKHNGSGSSWSNDEIALLLAISADAALDYREDGRKYARFGLKKQRKIDRLIGILERLKIPYTNNPVSKQGFRSICFHVPHKIESKMLPWWFVTNTTLEQKRFIIEEMVHWDGNHVPNRNQYEYSSKIKHNADVMQAVASTCGYASTIMERSKRMESGKICYWYKVSILFDKNTISSQAFNKNKQVYHAKQMVYCVTVPSGMILVRQKDKISVTGNCDALAAYESGFHNVVSVPLGAGNFQWLTENWDWLEQFPKIIVCADNDDPGIKMQKEVVFRLGSWRTMVVDIPQTVKTKNGREIAIKDLNEYLYYCGKEKTFELLMNAKDTPVPSLIDFADIEEQDLSSIEGIETGIQPLDKEIMRLFYSSLTVLSGTPGAGKTSLLSQIVCQSLEEEKPVWMFSRESPAWMTKNWIEHILAGRHHLKEFEGANDSKYWLVDYDAKKDISTFYKDMLKIYRDEYQNDRESLQTSMIDAVRKYGCRLFIIDNLMTVDLGGGEDLNERQTDFIKWLIQFAVKYGVAVVLVCHPRKLQTGITNVGIYDISGSSNIINLAHRAIGLKRVTPKERQGVEKENGGGWKVKPIKHNVILELIKDRLTGKANIEIGLYYDAPSRRFFTNEEEYNRQYRWDKGKYPALEYPIQDEEDEVYGKIKGGDKS